MNGRQNDTVHLCMIYERLVTLGRRKIEAQKIGRINDSLSNGFNVHARDQISFLMMSHNPQTQI